MTTIDERRRIRLWQDTIETEIEIRGNGPPLIFLHGTWGLHDRIFLDRLAPIHRVYAPRHPGTTAGHRRALRRGMPTASSE